MRLFLKERASGESTSMASALSVMCCMMLSVNFRCSLARDCGSEGGLAIYLSQSGSHVPRKVLDRVCSLPRGVVGSGMEMGVKVVAGEVAMGGSLR